MRCMANLSEAWVALDAIETGERVRVAGLLSGLRELGEKRGGVRPARGRTRVGGGGGRGAGSARGSVRGR